MIYSVWNQGRKVYDYYETPAVLDKVNAPKPHHVPGAGPLGVTPEHASYPLPAGAKHIGQGVLAQGRVAHRLGGRPMGGFAGMDNKTLLAAGLGLLFWWKTKKKR